MKRPDRKDYEDEHGFALTDNGIDDYADALESYINWLESDMIGCSTCKYSCGDSCTHPQGCEGEYELWEN